MSFRIGQPVVCIDDSGQVTIDGMPLRYPLVKGRVYTVKSISSCLCGPNIDVGLPLEGSCTQCPRCNQDIQGRVHYASRFAPLEPLKEEMDRIEESVLHEQVPELQPA